MAAALALDSHPQLAKAAGDRRRVEHQRRVATRANGLAVRIERLLRAYGLQRFAEIRRRLSRPRFGIRKQNLTRADLEQELLDVLRRFGLAQMTDAGKRTGQGGFEIVPEIWNEVQDTRQTKVSLLIEETDQQIRDSLDRIVGDALNETPRPTAAEVGRRIARSWFGPSTSSIPRRGEASEAAAIEQERLFSFDRAATIARTELAQAENAGIVQGLVAAGFVTAGWNAQRDPERSGERAHYLMNDHAPIQVEAIVTMDESGWFELPSGILTPYPQWSGLPAGESVNCGCFLTGRS